MASISYPAPQAQKSRRGRVRAHWKSLRAALKCGSLCGLSNADTISAYSEDLEKRGSYDLRSSVVASTVTAQGSDEKVPHAKSETTETRSQKALVVTKTRDYAIEHAFPVPHVADNEVMIRTVAVGLNPIDWKSVDYNFCLPELPWITGREMSGVVESVGKSVTTWQAGDKVWTSTYYRDRRAGCFQEFVVVPGHTVNRMPEELSFEQAACLGVAALTASMTLWRWLGVPMASAGDEAISQNENSAWLLIWGGSTVTGQFATQLAIQSGIKVITVNSQRTSEISYRLGASHVVVRDGKSEEELVEEICRITDGRITRAIDLVGIKTASVALKAISTSPSVVFAPLAMMAKDTLVPDNVRVETVEMKQYVLDSTCEVYAERLNNLIGQGRVAMPEITVIAGGLQEVVQGLDILKRGDMGGKKMVVRF
ncbi:chaperonin 10-like protein [Stachybotrys elegans]|uniref:Chaperonin 10-like protein n=1 Tax=Stachybotrys elegans TaxID=80388 RepID=A0A8K0SGR7_9HYPO|nr:chaperonin 10-like protein [Stachybotrys elegans]